MNRDEDSLASLFMDDRLGIYYNQYYMPSYWEANYSGEEAIEVVALPLPRRTKDQELKWVNSYDSQPINYTVITTSNKYPEISAQWLNMGFTREGILRHSYGVEGVDYELIDGSPVISDSVYEKDPDEFRLNYLMPNVSNFISIRAIYLQQDKDGMNSLSEQAVTNLTWGQNAVADINWGYTIFDGDSWGDFDSAFNDALTYAQPMVIKFIIGEESLDKFDEFKETTKSMGLEEAREIAQASIDKMQH